MVKVMVGHIWPSGEPQIKKRVALAGILLIGAKVPHLAKQNLNQGFSCTLMMHNICEG